MPRFGLRVQRKTKPIARVGEGLQRHCQENQYVAEGSLMLQHSLGCTETAKETCHVKV